MLQGDFFYIRTLETAGDAASQTSGDATSRTAGETVQVVLEINPAHAIFEGHFPGQPVVPGVCLMQMVKEITEKVLGKETRLVKADQIKFLAVLVPAQGQLLRMELKLRALDSGEKVVDAQLKDDATVFFKFKGLYAGA